MPISYCYMYALLKLQCSPWYILASNIPYETYFAAMVPRQKLSFIFFFLFCRLTYLSRECREKLAKVKPTTVSHSINYNYVNIALVCDITETFLETIKFCTALMCLNPRPAPNDICSL